MVETIELIQEVVFSAVVIATATLIVRVAQVTFRIVADVFRNRRARAIAWKEPNELCGIPHMNVKAPMPKCKPPRDRRPPPTEIPPPPVKRLM